MSPDEDPSPRELVLLKLGGSLVTDKRQETRARTDVIERLASELAEVWPRLRQRGVGLVLGHGSGSFGHVAAKRHGLGSGAERALRDRPVIGAADTQNEAARLHRLLVDALLVAGVPAWSWAPSTALLARGGRLASGDLRSLERALHLGLLPVVYGDVVLDLELGATIASTEAVIDFLVARLSRRGRSGRRRWSIRRLLWFGETAGIYDSAGQTIPTIDKDNLRTVRRQIGEAAGTDVTGGMLLRLRTAGELARRGIESWILDGRRPGALASALDDRPPSDLPFTRVCARSGS